MTLIVVRLPFNPNFILSVMWPFTNTCSLERRTKKTWNTCMSFRSNQIPSMASQNRMFVEILGSIDTNFTSQLSYCTVITMGSFLWGRMLTTSLLEEVILNPGSFSKFVSNMLEMVFAVRTYLTYFWRKKLDSSPLTKHNGVDESVCAVLNHRVGEGDYGDWRMGMSVTWIIFTSPQLYFTKNV